MMNIKILAAWVLILFALFVKESKVIAQDFIAEYVIHPITSYVHKNSAAYKKYEELQKAFERTEYRPDSYGIGSSIVLDFDLSEKNIKKMQSLWYSVQSIINEQSTSIENKWIEQIYKQIKDFNYFPAQGLTKDQLVLDVRCILAKNGYAPAFNPLWEIFKANRKHCDVDQYTKMAFNFPNADTIEKLREMQEKTRALNARLQEREQQKALNLAAEKVTKDAEVTKDAVEIDEQRNSCSTTDLSVATDNVSSDDEDGKLK